MKQILPLFIFVFLSPGLFAQLPAPKPHDFLIKGRDYVEKNMFPEAIITFKKAITLDKKYDSAYVELGSLFIRMTSFDSATLYFKKALAVNPTMASANIALGNVYRDYRPNLDSAIYCYKTALKTDSLNKVTFCSITWCYNAKQQYDTAITWGIRTLEIDNTYKPAYNELGHAYRRAKKFAEAIEQFKKNRAISVVDLAILYSGYCYTELKDKEGAMREYEELKKINEKMANALKKAIDKLN